MASRRKDFQSPRHLPTAQHIAADFMSQLMSGAIKATAVQFQNGRIVTYDDPDPDRAGAPPDRKPS
jgi:hypothetical protein